MHVLALVFPEISELLVWPDFFAGFHKIALINVLALLLAVAFYWVAGSKDAMVAPKGVRNMAEASVDFIEDGIVMETMGHEGLPWTPFLLTLFVYIFLTNITGIIPILQMPANARMAGPLVLAVIVWVTFIAVGVKHQGAGGYLKSSLFPPGVPKALYILVTPIEFISTFLVRPFSLAVRLFANMLAGHILLVTFAILTDSLITSDAVWLKPIFVLPWAMLIFLTAFEVLVCVLQAYIFTILAAVYIGGSMHPEH